MFNSKPLWWTSLVLWIIGSGYWHICRIKQLCDTFSGSQLPYNPPTLLHTGAPPHYFEILHYEINVDLLTEYLVIAGVAIILGFCTGHSYKSKKNQDLRYKLNRIERELEYYHTRT